jgi:hypothetical protein
MNDRQNAKLNMYQTTADVCNTKSEVFREVPAFEKSLSELTGIIVEIRQTEQQRDKTPVKIASAEKSDNEDKLIMFSIKVANGLYVYAFENNDLSLLTQGSINKSNFYTADSNKKLSLAKNIFQNTLGIAPNLSPYGITTEMLDNLEKVIADYEEKIVKPRDAMVEQKNHTYNLKALFASADSVLYDKMDKLIVLFKDTNTDFYNEYQSARNIIQTSQRHRKEENM